MLHFVTVYHTSIKMHITFPKQIRSSNYVDQPTQTTSSLSNTIEPSPFEFSLI